MKREKKEPVNLTEAEIFRKKVPNYLICFNDHCSRKEQCLRYLVGQYVDDSQLSCRSVNPRHRQVTAGQCPLFRQYQKVLKKRGMTRFYQDMPSRIEHAIRQELIGGYNRRVYYEYRNGHRLLDSEEVDYIVGVCERHGWTAPPVFDSEEEDYLW